jgi:hypothetical protein
MPIITPTYIMNFETDMRFVATNAWKRTLKKLWWPRVQLLETTGSAVQYIEWMLETARIQPLGPKGASMPQDPLVAVSQELVHAHFGNGLELFRSDIEDDKVARAPKWATDTGSAAAYWPQRLLVQAMQAGKVNKAFDGLPFFSTAHPVNPMDIAGATIANGGLYSNLHAGTSFTVENLMRVTAYIESIRHPGGAPMGALPTLVCVPSNYRFRSNQALNADIYTDALNTTQGASATNTIKTAYEFEPPIVAAELNNEPTVWYVGVPADQDAFDGAFGYLEREAFSINTYSPMDQASLANVNVFQWKNRGRNGSFYGLPFRWHRCESEGVQPTYLSSLLL